MKNYGCLFLQRNPQYPIDGGDVEGAAIVAEGDVGGASAADAAEEFGVGIENQDAAGACGEDIALRIDLETIG